MDKVAVFGTVDVGSIPAGGIQYAIFLIKVKHGSDQV
jgi:hypothetical protein